MPGLSQTVGQVLERLNCADINVRLHAIRDMKNAIIGNKTKKIAYIEAGALPRLVELLQVCYSEASMLVQLVATLGSFAQGSEDLTAMVEASDAMSALCSCLHHQDEKVVEGTAKAIRILLQSPNTNRREIFKKNTRRKLLEMLCSTDDGFAELAASIFARSCLTQEQQAMLVQDGAESLLLNILYRTTHPKCQEAVLDALSGVCMDNKTVCSPLAYDTSTMAKIFQLVRDPRCRTRLAAIRCITHIYRAEPSASWSSEVSLVVLPALVKLLSETGSPLSQAAQVLAILTADSEDLQKAACDLDAVPRLVSPLRTPDPEALVEDDMKENVYDALASLSSLREDLRKMVIDSSVLPYLVNSLGDRNAKVRAAACRCCRSLSRSVKHLRTSLVEAGVAMQLFRLLHDPSLEVQTYASAALCNIILDFSPMRKIIIDQGGVNRLIEMSKSHHTALRLNSVWALKNLLFMSDSTTKDLVIRQLTFQGLFELINDVDIGVQEQALTLLRNFVFGKLEDLERFFDGAGSELSRVIEKKLSSPNDEIIGQALYVLCNIATGGQRHKAFVMQPAVLEKIHYYLSHSKASVRVAATWCIINLTWKQPDWARANQSRVATLRGMGFENRLQAMLQDPDVDVKDRVRYALEQFQAAQQEDENGEQR
eukprot:GILJ01007772.1.p1 GENE.GILJ01007772.1~~GILJ01007772.1.p1  ORF type:complete len:655 (+),score=77.04 GILJ01007772.1:53-2017(+)